MIAALFVETNGSYFGLPGVDTWDETRDARKYPGPYPVVAHPPCQRWGKLWFGNPLTVKLTGVRKVKGDDGGCFESALNAVRKYGGVIEHPWGSHAWKHFGMRVPSRKGGWIVADEFGGWTCCVEQGRYGHYARKPTLIYAVKCDLPELDWGIGESRLDPEVIKRIGLARAKKLGEVCSKGGGVDSSPRIGTPPEFRELLLKLARSVNKPLDSTKVIEYHSNTVTEESGMRWWYHPESESYFQETYAVMEKNTGGDAALCHEVEEKDVPEQFKQEQQMSKCSVCGESQFKSLLGMNCPKGHLNAPPQPKEKPMTEQVAAAPAIPIDKLVQIYIKIRDKKAEIKKAFDAEYAKLDEKLSTVATELKSRAQAEGVEGFKSESGTVYLSETMKVTGSDWGAFGQFLKTHDPLEFMEKRISSTAIKAYMKESGGELPPGVSIFKEIEARVRRAGEK